MPVYNSEEWVFEAARSVLSQGGVSLELIAIDDGSTDTTPTILRQLANRDKRLMIVRLERNSRNIARALNSGLAFATGHFVARQDGDDISYNGRLLAQSELLTRYPRSLVGCQFHVMTDGPFDAWSAEKAIEEMCLTNPLHGTWMLERALIEQAGGYCEEFPVAQDHELIARLVSSHGLRVKIIPRTMYGWRAHHGNISHRRLSEKRALIRSIEARQLSS